MHPDEEEVEVAEKEQPATEEKPRTTQVAEELQALLSEYVSKNPDVNISIALASLDGGKPMPVAAYGMAVNDRMRTRQRDTLLELNWMLQDFWARTLVMFVTPPAEKADEPAAEETTAE